MKSFKLNKYSNIIRIHVFENFCIELNPFPVVHQNYLSLVRETTPTNGFQLQNLQKDHFRSCDKQYNFMY